MKTIIINSQPHSISAGIERVLRRIACQPHRALPLVDFEEGPRKHRRNPAYTRDLIAVSAGALTPAGPGAIHPDAQAERPRAQHWIAATSTRRINLVIRKLDSI
jgi:hypothetical protein